jgi:multiple sugar transport system ATP-binding protein
VGTFTVKVPKDRYDLYRPHKGKKLIFGIRPENISHINYQPTDITPSPVDATVDVVEEMGNEKILYLEKGGKTFLARIDPRADVHVGETVGLAFNADLMHLFDAETEQALQ